MNIFFNCYLLFLMILFNLVLDNKSFFSILALIFSKKDFRKLDKLLRQFEQIKDTTHYLAIQTYINQILFYFMPIRILINILNLSIQK